MIKSIIIIALLLTGISTILPAQKRQLTSEDYQRWKRVDGENISDDGRWVIWRTVKADDFGGYGRADTLYLYDSVKRKYHILQHAATPCFFAQGKWLSYTLPDTSAMQQDTTVLLRLKDMKSIYWDKPVAFTPIQGSSLVSWSEKIKCNPADTSQKAPVYNRLTIWNITTGDTLSIDSIGLHRFTEDNSALFYLQNKPQGNALCYRRLNQPTQTIFYDTQLHIDGFQWDSNHQKGTFSIASDSLIWEFAINGSIPKEIFRKNTLPLPKGFRTGSIRYEIGNNWLTYELIPENYRRQRQTTLPKKEKDFELQLWSWNDRVIQSRQEKDGLREETNFPKYIYWLNSNRNHEIVPAEATRTFTPPGNNYTHLLYSDEHPYRYMQDWKESLPFDLYITDLTNGQKKILQKAASIAPEWSRDGKYALLYSDSLRNWLCFNTYNGNLTNISSAIGYPIWNEQHDKPSSPKPYGIAGWTPDNRHVVIYDRYDMWVLDLEGQHPPYSLTQGYGRKNEMTIRLLSSNFETEIIDLQQEYTVETFCERNKNAGFYTLKPGGKMIKLLEGPWSFRIHKIADNRKSCIFTRQNYTEFRDLWWSPVNFSHPIRLTNVNPQYKEYNWGTAELTKWTNYEGKENHGILYLPGDYVPNKKYPVLVQFYETHTEALHVYHTPTLSAAMADIPTYVSNGYIVFSPDIHFTIGHPGESAYNAVISGVKHLIDKGIADPDRIGLQGHSWSGFLSAYLVTRTDIFRCANIGAPIVDMISGYTGIREGSGLVRFFMYEDTQSRMGKSVWEAKEAYLAHFPLLQADKITSPLLIFHNDADEAVPYEHGRSLYFAMRRLQKPAWLLNYKGEGHFLDNNEAQKDWTVRMQQFFDYYLKDASMPRWMKEGINIHERGYK